MSLYHHMHLRVMWPDTDPAGIVWFGVFCRYLECAEEELFRALGRDRTELLRESNVFMPRTSLSCSFRSPARLGDEISVGVGVAAITERRIAFAFDIHERGTERLILDASYRVACVDARTFAPRSFPQEIVTLLTLARGRETMLESACGSREREPGAPSAAPALGWEGASEASGGGAPRALEDVDRRENGHALGVGPQRREQ